MATLTRMPTGDSTRSLHSHKGIVVSKEDGDEIDPSVSALAVSHDFLFQHVHPLRALARRVQANPLFEAVVFCCVLATVVAMIVEDVPARLSGVDVARNRFGRTIDKIAVAVFTVEFVVRVLAHGLAPLPAWVPQLLRPDKRMAGSKRPKTAESSLSCSTGNAASSQSAPDSPSSIRTGGSTKQYLVSLDDVQNAQGQYYLASNWNRLDFAMLIVGYMSVFADQKMGLSSLRSLRALRPLRMIHFLAPLQVILRSVWRAMATLVDVFICLCFMYLFFALMGQQMYQGSLLRRCVVPAGDDALRFDVSSPLHTELMRNLSQSVVYAPTQYTVYQPTTYCSLASDPKSFSCADVGVSPIVAVSTAAGSAVFVQVPLVCVVTNENPDRGFVGFDNLMSSLWTVFMMSSLEVSCSSLPRSLLLPF